MGSAAGRRGWGVGSRPGPGTCGSVASAAGRLPTVSRAGWAPRSSARSTLQTRRPNANVAFPGLTDVSGSGQQHRPTSHFLSTMRV